MVRGPGPGLGDMPRAKSKPDEYDKKGRKGANASRHANDLQKQEKAAREVCRQSNLCLKHCLNYRHVI